ncbi:MAG: HAMP domain-containing histidine kinase [Deltaproteobacteria bacterium]|nr:HAMP domain-containing histidine kinase [Candidatus Zymogenaceae bacterium]
MKREKIRIVLMGILLILLGGITYYFHQVRHSGTVFTHLFYIPIILSAYWWKRRGIVVALLLSLLIILSGLLLQNYSSNIEDYIRAGMFLIVSLVAVIAAERIEKINERLNQTEIALAQSEKIAGLGQLAAGVAHELNNPLGIIVMYAHLLRDENSESDTIHEQLDTIINEADRCKTIVADLLRFSRAYTLSFRPVNLNTLLRNVLRRMKIGAGIDVTFEPRRENITIHADKEQLRQAFRNIIQNAIEAMDAGGALRLSIDDDEENAWITIRDSGIGIPPDAMGRIFEPFYTTKRSGKGTGLGLAVSYGMVKMHEGDISVDSNADPMNGPTGTNVTVLLPKHVDKPIQEGVKKTMV